MCPSFSAKRLQRHTSGAEASFWRFLQSLELNLPILLCKVGQKPTANAASIASFSTVGPCWGLVVGSRLLGPPGVNMVATRAAPLSRLQPAWPVLALDGSQL